MRTWSIKLLISSTELFEAASSSYTFKEAPELKLKQDSHLSQASVSFVLCVQLIVFAKILAVVVFPTPLIPVKMNAWANLPLLRELLNVLTSESCPISSLKSFGLYLRAKTL